MEVIKIPSIGTLTKDIQSGTYSSELIPITVLGRQCQIIIDGYDEDLNKEEFNTAIANFISIDLSVLKAAEQYIFDYYKEVDDNAIFDGQELIQINSPSDVWNYIRLGKKAMVVRRSYGDRGIYILLSCACDWEDEHGLLIVFKNGLKVSRISSCDGHISHADADDSLEEVIYH
jgi:hypothetical protein